MRHFAHDTPSDLDRRILAGQTNEQIRADLGPLNKDILYRCRKKHGMVPGERRTKHGGDEADPRGQICGRLDMSRGCPKCKAGRGAIKRGGVRFGVSADDVLSCLLCGTNSESESYHDAFLGVRVEM